MVAYNIEHYKMLPNPTQVWLSSVFIADHIVEVWLKISRILYPNSRYQYINIYAYSVVHNNTNIANEPDIQKNFTIDLNLATLYIFIPYVYKLYLWQTTNFRCATRISGKVQHLSTWLQESKTVGMVVLLPPLTDHWLAWPFQSY